MTDSPADQTPPDTAGPDAPEPAAVDAPKADARRSPARRRTAAPPADPPEPIAETSSVDLFGNSIAAPTDESGPGGDGAAVDTGTDPAGTDPTGTDPTGTDPTGTDPTGTDPTGTDPTGTDPTGADPAGTDPPRTPTPKADEPPDRSADAAAVTAPSPPADMVPAVAAADTAPPGAISAAAPPAVAAPAADYRVLARKYRPKTFTDMIGQDALVRTLSNAFATGRIAHAFVMTGVRGVGKTTTARIIARALNCIGPDGTGGPTIAPCGVCEPCVAIAGDRHVDVMEMDAASRTGVDDIREIIDGVRYRPVSARYKVYIIDEIHMLTKNAFNALLKTLEEPPRHVKFIFATTEIRKLPVTVLSRCQRFDLRRVGADALVAHFGRIAAQEGADVDPAALRLVARAADGSVRDGLSLLDQAIALSDGRVDEEQVRTMIGLADRSLVFDLLAAALTGDPAAALDRLGGMYAAGADPATVLQDLMELVHWLTRAKVAPDSARGAEAAGLSDSERDRALALSRTLTMPALTRAWQLLLKGLQETRGAPMPLQAAEMVLVRLAFAADLPDPATLVRQLAAGNPPSGNPPSGNLASGPVPGPAGSGGTIAGGTVTGGGIGSAPGAGSRLSAVAGGRTHAVAQPDPTTDTAADPPDPQSFEAVAALMTERREGIIAGYLINFARLVAFEPGRITVRFDTSIPTDLTAKIGRLLTGWTGRRWHVDLSDQPGAPTLTDQRKAAEDTRRVTAIQHPLVQAVLKTFPGAVIKTVKTDADMPPAPDDRLDDGEPPGDGGDPGDAAP